MIVTKIKIKKLIPNKGHIGFVSFVVDDWLYLGNIAIFSRLNEQDKIRLVFPEKKSGDKKISIFYPLTHKTYYELEQIVLNALKTL
jgi:DNA-binding cell septation regulator SpoVG